MAMPGLCGGAMLANEFIRLPIHFLGMLPPGTPRWGKAHKDAMRKYYRHTIAVQGPTQEMPIWDSRVQLDPKVKDRWGIPVLRISGRQAPAHHRDRQRRWRKSGDVAEGGGRDPRPGRSCPGRGVSGGQHQAGTCRMGNDPQDQRRGPQLPGARCAIMCSSIDGSVHVTNGGFNPVLTIMANAYRASEYIVKAWKGTRFRS